jgi:1,4-alpha-glucan branching enzyme
MATENQAVGTFSEFADNILPRIKKQGYNTIQLMAIMEHPFYGSYGYHVSSFFAPSSRFGTPEEFKLLVEKAHEMGLAVIIDLVHSHAVKNFNECFTKFDGSEDMYFHAGDKGYHKLWDSMLFNYEKPEVLQFLLSNVRYWLEEFNLDGFRFDGITSMLYLHHGHHIDFDNYEKYFDAVDGDAFLYLQLANKLIHSINPHAISIAEDMSGMPGLGLPQEIGGLGFDYRLGMGIPDYWIKILKEQKDEEWDLDQLWQELSSRRHEENTIAYCESHDQALVGDKTIAFRLMDKEMYWHMHKDDGHPVVSRGMALHKMIRLITILVGGESWLNFIGNEFGHPEWIDFPREGNNWSYQHARRQWSLVDDNDLKYQYLNSFDEAMVKLSVEENVLSAEPAKLLNIDSQNMVMAFERAGLVCVFNFNVKNSLTDYLQGVPFAGSWQILLSSDEPRFGGGGHQDLAMSYPSKPNSSHGCSDALELYLISRSAIVLKVKR